jgi:hypothetical protein
VPSRSSRGRGSRIMDGRRTLICTFHCETARHHSGSRPIIVLHAGKEGGVGATRGHRQEGALGGLLPCPCNIVLPCSGPVDELWGRHDDDSLIL